MNQTKLIALRINEQCEAEIDKLLRLFPSDYKTQADVLRAGVYALKRWKVFYEKKEV